MKMKLWHCHNARSLRPLWALEEMGFDYEVVELPFPPRVFQKDYLGVNALGTVPYFTDGDATMTESSGICHYLVERYGRHEFGLKPDHVEYADYINWLFHSDATLTFPQAIVMRYRLLEPEERRLPQAADDYARWYIARLRRLDAHLLNRKYLCDGRFTIADICVGYALYLGRVLGLDRQYQPQTTGYLSRLMERPAFKKTVVVGKSLSPWQD
jgi:glutathione S-transferase